MNIRLLNILILVCSFTHCLSCYSTESILLDSILINYQEIDGFKMKPKFRTIKIINTAERQQDTTLIDEIMINLFDSVKVIESREVDIIYDISLIIIVNHIEKSILMRKSGNNLNNSFISSIFHIKELENQNIINTNKSKNYTFLTFESNQRFQLPYKKNNMIIKIDCDSNLISSIEHTAFSMGADVRFRQIMTYIYNDNIKNEYTNSLSYIFNSKNQLISKYTNYRIINK